MFKYNKLSNQLEEIKFWDSDGSVWRQRKYKVSDELSELLTDGQIVEHGKDFNLGVFSAVAILIEKDKKDLGVSSSSNTDGLFLWNSIDNEMVEVDNFEDARQYVKDNFTDNEGTHPDFDSFDVFQKVGDVSIQINDNKYRIVANSIQPPASSKVDERGEIGKLNLQIGRLKSALRDIVDWTDEMEEKWGDPGHRASQALQRYKYKRENPW